MIRLESLELEHSEEAQEELLALAEALRAAGAEVEVAGPDEPRRARLQESVSEAVDVLNVVVDVAKDLSLGVLANVIHTWARERRRFRGAEPDDRPHARLWVIEDGREYDYPIDLDREDEDERR